MQKKFRSKNIIMFVLLFVMTLGCILSDNHIVHAYAIADNQRQHMELVQNELNRSMEATPPSSEEMYLLDLSESVMKEPISEAQNEYKKLRNTLDNKEFRSIHGYAKGPVMYNINTPTASLGSAYGYNQGTLYCNDWGMSVRCYLCNDQRVADAYNSACVETPDYGSVPIGVNGTSLIGDHNTQDGGLWYNARNGQLLYARTPHGEFTFKVTRTGVATNTPDGRSFVMQSDGLDVVNYAASGQFNGIILFTCYPRYQRSGTTQRYVVFAEKVAGTNLV